MVIGVEESFIPQLYLNRDSLSTVTRQVFVQECESVPVSAVYCSCRTGASGLPQSTPTHAEEPLEMRGFSVGSVVKQVAAVLGDGCESVEPD